MDGWTRPVMGILALPLGLGVTAWPDGWGLWVFASWILCLPTGFGFWAEAGGVLGLIIGIFLLLTIAGSFLTFWADHESKKSWYILWSAAGAYFIPFTILHGWYYDHWRCWASLALSVVMFAAFTFLYWRGPRLLERWAEKRAREAEEIEEVEE